MAKSIKGKIEDPMVPLERNLCGHPLAGIAMGKAIRRSVIRTWMWENSELGMYVSSSETKGYFFQFLWTTSKWLERIRKWLQCGKKLMRNWTLMNPHHFFTMCIWDALSGSANQMKQSLNRTQRCLNHIFLLEQQKNYRGRQKPHTQTVAWSYDIEGHAQKLCWAILWVSRQQSGATLQSFASLLGWSPF